MGNSSFDTQKSVELLAEYINESKHLRFLDIQNQIGSPRIHLTVTKSRSNNDGNGREQGQIIIKDSETGRELFNKETKRKNRIMIWQ